MRLRNVRTAATTTVAQIPTIATIGASAIHNSDPKGITHVAWPCAHQVRFRSVRIRLPAENIITRLGLRANPPTSNTEAAKAVPRAAASSWREWAWAERVIAERSMTWRGHFCLGNVQSASRLDLSGANQPGIALVVNLQTPAFPTFRFAHVRLRQPASRPRRQPPLSRA